jgi:hypothetical protein
MSFSRSCGTSASLQARDRDDVVVEPFQREPVQVGEVAGDVKLGELALPAGQVLRPRKPARQQKQRVLELLALPDDGLVGLDVNDFGHEPADRLFLLGADPVACPQLLEMCFDHWTPGLRMSRRAQLAERGPGELHAG